MMTSTPYNQAAPAADRVSVKPFVSGHSRALWVTGFLILNIALSIFAAISTLAQNHLIETASMGRALLTEIAENDSRQGAIGLAQSVVYVVTGILFLMWIHRAYQNLPALGAQNLRHSATSAVLWFFVPIAWVFKPYQVVKEIWNASGPHEVANTTQPKIGLWWIFFLMTNFAAAFASQLTLGATSLMDLQTAGNTSIAGEVISIVAALLAIGVVSAIDDRQESAFRQQVNVSLHASGDA